MIEINEDLCTKCESCVKSCPSEVFEMETSGPKVVYMHNCIECGHCVAVCPVDAVNHTHMPHEDFQSFDAQIDYETLHGFTRMRRSIRRFKNKPVPREMLEKIMASVRYIPTGSNAQGLKYIVITNPDKITAIAEKMNRIFYRLYKMTRGALIRGIIRLFTGKGQIEYYLGSLERLIHKWEQGEDPALRHAPALITWYSTQKLGTAGLDAGIAGYHINLIAQSLGLGSCWIGFHSIMAKYSRKLRKLTGIPKGGHVQGTVVLGYPQLKYQRSTFRRPLQAEFLE